MARSSRWCMLLAVIACATSPESPDPGVLRLHVAADATQLSPAGRDSFPLMFWNERAYRDDGMWAEVFDSLTGWHANHQIRTDTVEVLAAASFPPGVRIACSYLPPAWYDSLTMSVHHLGFIVLGGTRIPVTSAREERRCVLPHRFRLRERDTLDLRIVCHVESSLRRRGDELVFTPVLSVEEVTP